MGKSKHIACRQGAVTPARRLLSELRKASIRLGKTDDDEALHRFRVRVRRLRAFLRAYRQLFDASLIRKVHKRLGVLIDATNISRDLQVQTRWLSHTVNHRRTGPRARDAAAHLLDQLTTENTQSAPTDHLTHRKQTAKTLKLVKRLLAEASDKAEGGTGPDPHEAFNRLAGKAILRSAGKLGRQLASITTVDDHEHCHEARLNTKRLRYILEPMRNDTEGIDQAVGDLCRLQDLMGELRDRHVLSAVLAGRLGAEARAWSDELIQHARQAEPYPYEAAPIDHQARCLGLRDLIHRCEHEQRVLYRRLTRLWLEDKGESGLARTRRIGQALRGHTPPAQTAATDSVTAEMVVGSRR